MMKRSFISLSKPQLNYGNFAGKVPVPQVPKAPQTVRLYLKEEFDRRRAPLLEVGQAVTCGERLVNRKNSDAYTVASIDGKISSIIPMTGDFGQAYTEVTIEAVGDGAAAEAQDPFTAAVAEPSLEMLTEWFACVPGEPNLKALADPSKSINTIVVSGVDQDLLVTTTQYVLQTRIDALTKGIELLKQVAGVDQVVLAVTRDMFQGYGHIGAEARAVSSEYPAGLPRLVMQELFQQVVPAGKTCEDLGVLFVTAEAVAAMGTAFENKQLPISKLITIIDKDLQSHLVEAKIGSPLRDLFDTVGIQTEDGDRVIIGGPMRGSATYSENFAVKADTDAIMVQDRADVALVSDTSCINCGDCIRACPVNIPVNMLVRFLEAGQYEDAAGEYDLYCCIECGLCSYVCVSKIPIFQYIRLAQYELARLQLAEAGNE